MRSDLAEAVDTIKVILSSTDESLAEVFTWCELFDLLESFKEEVSIMLDKADRKANEEAAEEGDD